MPAKPSYSLRLEKAARLLEDHPGSPWVDRRELEEALGVSKTVAWRLMKQSGARQGPGSTLVCDRQALVQKLRQLQGGGSIHEREVERQGRLDQFLSRLRSSVQANLTGVASHQKAVALVSSRFRKLPPNVELTSHSLHITFQGMEEFLESFGAVVYALHNDLDEVRKCIES